MVHPDQNYIDALLHNNPAVQQELYDRFFGKIKKMVLDNNGTPQDATDVMQDALLAIYYRAKKSPLLITNSFEALLYVVCRNKWLKELGKRKVAQETIDEQNNTTHEEDSISLLEEYLLHRERENLILEKLNNMKEGCRKLLQLCWSGKSMHEVAAILGTTYAYARKKKCGCMSRLITLVQQSERYDALR